MNDVFVSYSHRDEDWVRKSLLPRLQAWRLDVVIDRDRFLPGSRLNSTIAAAIAKCRHAVFVCTPSFLASPHCRFELETVMLSDPDVMGTKPMPVVLDPRSVPDLFPGDLLRCHLDRDEPVEWEKLCLALGGDWLGSTFFGGFLAKDIRTCIVARSHNSSTRGVSIAIGAETADAYADMRSLLMRRGKTENVTLVLSDDVGCIRDDVALTENDNFIFIGGTSQAEDYVARLAGRTVAFRDEPDMHYLIDELRIPLAKDRLSFFIYKNRSRSRGGNILYLFSPWPIGCVAATRMLGRDFGEFSRIHGDGEWLSLYEGGFDLATVELVHAHRWSEPAARDG